MRQPRCARPRLPSSRAALAQARAPAQALQEWQPVGEEHALEVIHLVLQADCGKTVESLLVLAARRILAGDAHVDAALHARTDPGDRQAAFLDHRPRALLHRARVDEHLWLISLRGYIDDDDLAMQVDLGRSETDRPMGVERLQQVGNLLVQHCVEAIDRDGPLPQARVRQFKDWQHGHRVQPDAGAGASGAVTRWRRRGSMTSSVASSSNTSSR